MSWIVDSIERQAQRNPFELSGLFGYEAGGTVYTRVARVVGSDGMVGYALDALREACFGEHAERLILVDFEALTRGPGPTVKALYKLLGEPLFGHDFEDVSYAAEVFDAALGTPGLHEVRGRVEWRPRPTVLPPDLFERFAGDSFWRKPQPRMAHVPADPLARLSAPEATSSAPATAAHEAQAEQAGAEQGEAGGLRDRCCRWLDDDVAEVRV